MAGGDRLRVTLLDRMSTLENGRSSVTLEDVLMTDITTSRPQPPPSLSVPATPARNRSLLDVMRRDRRRNKSTWTFLRDKLRFKRTAISWISYNPIPTPEFLETNRSNGEESRLQLGTVLSEERSLSVQQPPRMSLMELLEDNDGPMYDVSERKETVTEEGETVTATTTAELACCVCMVRRKGAAFIPCGHTFCRLCCRELWVQRGNCPLCNTSILQVLDIF